VAPANESSNRTDNALSTTAFGRYARKAFRNEQRNRNGQLPHTEEEHFSLCVAGRLLCKFSEKNLYTEFADGQQQLCEFNRRLEDAMAQDREQLKAGLKASMFKTLPERKLLRDAVRDEIRDRTHDKELSNSDLEEHEKHVEESGPSPLTHTVAAEEAEKLHDALATLDATAQEILHRMFTDNQKQVEIARDLDMTTSTVNRKFQKALLTLEGRLRQQGVTE
jgi:hypothetical protein